MQSGLLKNTYEVTFQNITNLKFTLRNDFKVELLSKYYIFIYTIQKKIIDSVITYRVVQWCFIYVFMLMLSL